MSARQPQALPVFLQRHHLILGIENRVLHHEVQMMTAISGLPNDLRKFEKIRHLL